MKNRKLIGWLLIIAVLFMIAGIILNNHIFWSFVDIIVVITCLGSGLYILLRKE